jgi:hypothetical protein
MNSIDEILRSGLKPKEKQSRLVDAVCDGLVGDREFIDFFLCASDIDKGACADAMKHISSRKPELLAPHIDTLAEYINYKAPRVKWGIPETIGNLAVKYPEKTAKTVPFLLKNTADNGVNTTVIRWCAAYALSKIALNSSATQKKLIASMREIAAKETNNGVRNVYVKTLKSLEK